MSTIFFHFQYHSHFTNNMKGLQKSFKMVLDSSLYDLSYHSYVCQSTANIVKISPKLRFLDDHNSKNTRLMWLKFGVAKLLYICIDLTKFKENPEGLSFFCVDLTWNDPFAIPGNIHCHCWQSLSTHLCHSWQHTLPLLAITEHTYIFAIIGH